jgi:hypothetical protein
MMVLKMYLEHKKIQRFGHPSEFKGIVVHVILTSLHEDIQGDRGLNAT